MVIDEEPLTPEEREEADEYLSNWQFFEALNDQRYMSLLGPDLYTIECDCGCRAMYVTLEEASEIIGAHRCADGSPQCQSQ